MELVTLAANSFEDNDEIIVYLTQQSNFNGRGRKRERWMRDIIILGWGKQQALPFQL